MSITRTSRAIIEVEYNSKKCIVTIKRTKYKNNKIVNEYYTLPGGHVEKNETTKETIVREVFEELNVNISVKEKFLSIYNKDLDRYEEFYICNIISGKISAGSGPEWVNEDIEKYGAYSIEYIDVNDIDNYNILPIEVKDLLLKKYRSV